MINNPSTAVYTAVDNLAPQAEERIQGLGYGPNAAYQFGTPNYPSVALDGTSTLYPTGQLRPYENTPYSGANIQDRLRFKMDDQNNVPAVSNVAARSSYQMPLYTFGYWEFKVPYNDCLF